LTINTLGGKLTGAYRVNGLMTQYFETHKIKTCGYLIWAESSGFVIFINCHHRVVRVIGQSIAIIHKPYDKTNTATPEELQEAIDFTVNYICERTKLT